jgi:DNA-binding MarR family transcriptional regulator
MLSSALLDDARVQMLRPALFKMFINLALYAQKHGGLGSISDLAWALRVSQSAISRALEDLAALELVSCSDGAYQLVRRAAKKKPTGDRTAAQRMRRHRERKSERVTVPVTAPVTVDDRNSDRNGLTRVTPELLARSLASLASEEEKEEARLASLASESEIDKKPESPPKKPPEAESGLMALVTRLAKYKLPPPPDRLEADLLAASPSGLAGVLEAFRAANLEARDLRIESYGYFVTIVRSHFRAAAARAS